MKLKYKNSVELALFLGYEERLDENAFQGRCYVKDEEIWIHNIKALKQKLDLSENSELAAIGYDVNAYIAYRDHTEEMANAEMKGLYQAVNHEDGGQTYMMDGMWLFTDGSMREL